MVVAKKFVVKQSFDGEPKESDFLLVEEELPQLKENEFLSEAAYLSMDPYQRIKIGNKFPCDMIGGQIAKVIESRNSDYPVGTWVMGHFGWRTRTVVTPESEKKCEQKPFIYRLPDFGDLPVSLALGVCGRVGNTSYFGFTEICKPEPGHTVVVSGAAGAVGSHVGQIAKIYGCKVIGLAGTDEKCEWLKSIGFDAAGNYKTVNIEEFVKENAPNGIDSYFDNVGGEISRIVMSQMKDHGRVAVCGAISKYNSSKQESIKTLLSLNNVTEKALVITPFLVNQFAERTLEGIQKNLQWVKDGKLQYKEHVTEGFENTPNAFIGMFRGENTGKAIVKV